MAKANVLVTAVGGRSVGSGILHALLRCGDQTLSRWNLFAADANSFSWGLYMVENHFLLPMANEPHYLEYLLEMVKKHNIHAILPGSEVEVDLLSQHVQSFANTQIICNDNKLMPLMMDKLFMYTRLNELGISTIPTYPLKEWQTLLSRFGFPLIIKPYRGTGGSRGVDILLNQSDLNNYLAENNTNYCLQPYLGTEDDEYTVGVLTDKEGLIIDSIVMKRKLLGLSLLKEKKQEAQKIIISSGYSQGYIIKDKEIQNFCEDLALKLQSKGPLNIQLRKHKGEVFVFEVHPRFSGTTPIRASVGFNEVDILLQNFIYNKKFGRIPYQYNVAAIRAFEHKIVPIETLSSLTLS